MGLGLSAAGLAMMSWQTGDQSQLFYLFNLEGRIPANDLLRRINLVATRVLAELRKKLAPFYVSVWEMSQREARLVIDRPIYFAAALDNTSENTDCMSAIVRCQAKKLFYESTQYLIQPHRVLWSHHNDLRSRA